MGKIVKIPTKETGSWLENLALAHNLLDEDKPEECLVLLNKLEYDGTDAEMLRGKAFSRCAITLCPTITFSKPSSPIFQRAAR